LIYLPSAVNFNIVPGPFPMALSGVGVRTLR